MLDAVIVAMWEMSSTPESALGDIIEHLNWELTMEDLLEIVDQYRSWGVNLKTHYLPINRLIPQPHPIF